MTDAMFTFASHALASGHATGTFPGMGGARLTGGSPRYQLYPTKDGKLVCCAALEQRFWGPFTATIGLAPQFIDDSRDPAATKAAVAAIIAGRSADEWRPLFAAADCCVTIMATWKRRCAIRISSSGCSHQVAGPTRCDHAGAAGADRSAVPRRSAMRRRFQAQRMKAR
jgi:crotonobetainyl-CoA:carnitine CoA-transferase CaiB-like acyl-CoA transferase